MGTGRGYGSFSGKVLECTDGRATMKLVEDGYVSVENGNVEIGLLRDYGGWVEKREFEDGTIYIYSENVNGNGIFSYVQSWDYTLYRGVPITASIFLFLSLAGGPQPTSFRV